ncbi:MAG: hypothetical protein EZS28_009165 [Streblomastix strix]|uniref:Tyr recombinase domain-containing protein n=1 Tax=Streblomastix strix TaxID=222440 RepID=A0A5J4WL65_9EUKA|nr:MAG: hypothetical protein EZS28_009165 [Streblomastix strix]
MILKKPAGKVKISLKQMNDKCLCPIEWLKKWAEIKQYQEGECWILGDLKLIKPEQWSRYVRYEMVRAGIDKAQSVTSIRAAAITKAFQLGATTEAVNRWTRHSNATSTIQKYYDKKRNDDIREKIVR